MEDALAQLGPGCAAPPLDPASREAVVEEELGRSEAALDRAARAARVAASMGWDEADLRAAHARQSAALDRAAALQAEVDRRHLDDAGAVLLANLVRIADRRGASSPLETRTRSSTDVR